jgi:hypothetical protein
MTSNLTNRYVAATLRRVPEKQRSEIERELRAAIADDVDARIDAGDTADKAEYAALKEIGDPYRLAASYSNRPLTLIGPDLYPSYVRSLKIFGWATLPIVAIVLVVINAVEGKSVATVIFGPIGTVINLAIYLAFVLTLVFAIAERATPSETGNGVKRFEWTPDLLPMDVELPRLVAWNDVLAQIGGAVVVVALLLVDRYAPVVTNHAGHTIPVVAPELWRFWIPLFFAILALTIIFEIVKVRVGRWNLGTAIAGTILGALGAGAIVVAVLTTTVVNPALTTSVALHSETWTWIWRIVAIVVGLVWVGTTINDWRPTNRRPRVPQTA